MILRHNIAGMRLSGILAIGVVVVFLIGSALEGKEIILIPGHAYSGDQVALVDKLAIALMGGALLIASVFKKGLIHGRLIVAVGLVTTVFAMVADDAARRDPSFAPIYTAIAFIAVVSAMPFRPLQTVLLACGVIGSYFATLTIFAKSAGYGLVGVPEGHLLTLVLLGSVLSGVSLFLYNLRFQQYRLQRNMRLLKERVERQAVSLARKNQFIRQVFGRYLTDEVVERLLESPSGLQIGGYKAAVTILMADIRGFSNIAEERDAHDVVLLLNTYLESMTEVIGAFGGTIDEFIGDAIMVIFGAPETRPDDAFRAVACAVAMQRATEEVNAINKSNGLPKIGVGIGVHTGEAVVGNIGSEARAKYGVVGSVVNVAARIESYSVGGQILISESTLRSVNASVQVRKEQFVEPKGAADPIRIFEVAGVGDPYNILIPEETQNLIPIRGDMNVEFSILEEKFVGRTVHRGRFVAVSSIQAELHSDIPLPALSNLKLSFFDKAGERVPGDVFAKVVSAGDSFSVYTIHFTSLSPECQLLLEAHGASAY